MNATNRNERLGHLKDEMRKLEILFEETEIAFGDLSDAEKKPFKGLASAIEYHASKLKD